MPKSCIDTRMANIVFSNDSNVSNIGVQVKEYKYDYDGESYFYIDYNNTFSGDENRVNSSHPFFNTKYIEHISGDIIFKNSYTTELIKMLLMDNIDLKQFISTRSSNTNKTIDTQTNDTRFYPSFYLGEENNVWCDITINVETFVYSGVYFYRITYNCQPNSNNSNSSFYNQFNKLTKIPYTIYKNNVTTELVKYLLMDNEELSLYSGRTTPEKYKRILIHFINMMHKVTNVTSYKKNIMKHIFKLWD